MKLVDILARELKAWPEGLECLSQIKGTGYIINGKGFDGRAFDDLQIADETLVAGAIVTRAEWQAAVDALNTPKVVEWDGVGIPPVGALVEIHEGGVEWESREFIGKQGKVIILFRSKCGQDILVVEFDDGKCSCFTPEVIKSVRTAEQVAAEEREKARTEVLNAMTANGKTANEPEALWQFRLKVVGEMLDMGYRKDTKPCGS